VTARRCLGFTLVEVLVALAVVAVTLASGIKAAGALTQNAERLADQRLVLETDGLGPFRPAAEAAAAAGAAR